MAITWSESLSVGVVEIDVQHRRLVELINQLDDAMKTGKGKDALGATLASLVRYTQTHFNAEEKLMATHGYPALASHRQEHEQLTRKVQEFVAQFQAGRVGLTIPMMTFLENWLVTHIQGTDMKYAPYFKAKGIR